MTTRLGVDSGRLKLQTALRRNGHFEAQSVEDFGTKSASLAKAERQIKALKEENLKLRTELEETRSTLHQLVTESSHECFDERRVNLLKCQIIQLERQMLLLSDAIGGRTESLMEVENVLCWLADNFRSYITAEVKGPSVPVERRELTRMVESTESARIKLFKNIENCSKQTLSRPLLLMNKFILPGREEETSLLDVAAGKLEHLNLKHVAQLESKLSLLYKELIRVHELMMDADSANHRLFSCHVTTMIRERLKTQVLTSCAMMKGCADDLLALSLLYPSAPWPVLKKPVVEDVSCERFMAGLPTLPRSKTQAVEQCVFALLKTCNFRHHMMDKQVKTLKNEIKFHQKVYSHQVEYMEALFDSLRDSYCSFEKSMSDVFVEPMKNILDAYYKLEVTASEQALKKFLSTFKENKQQFSDALEKFNRHDENGEEKDAVSSFGEEYFKSLETLVKKQQQKRDRASKKDEKLRHEQEQLDEELRSLLKDIEYEKSAPKQAENSAENVDIVSVRKESSHRNENISKTLSLKQNATGLDVVKNHEELTSDAQNSERVFPSKITNHSPSLPPTCSMSAERTKTSSRRNSSQLSYEPNLQVAKGTLQLKRAGSLSRLSSVRSPSSTSMGSDFNSQSNHLIDQLHYVDGSSSQNDSRDKRTKVVLQKPPFK